MIPESSATQAIALAEDGWNLSQIARHLGHDRKTIRIYLNGSRVPGQQRPEAVSFAPFANYVARRMRDDPHLRASGLHRELAELGYPGSYSALTRALRSSGITTQCAACQQTSTNTSALTPIGLAQHRRFHSLPIRVAPITGETVASYLARLAAANHVPVSLILAHLPSWFIARIDTHDDLTGAVRAEPAGIEHLASLAGLSTASLVRALPAFGFGCDSHPGRPPVRAIHACRRCAARHGHTGPIPVHLPAHQRLCTRHRIWLGSTHQIDIAAVPELVHAQRRAARLAHRHGALHLLLAEITAHQQIIATKRDDQYPEPVQRRIATLTAPDRNLPLDHPDLIEAVTYPETISNAAHMLLNRAR